MYDPSTYSLETAAVSQALQRDNATYRDGLAVDVDLELVVQHLRSSERYTLNSNPLDKPKTWTG